MSIAAKLYQAQQAVADATKDARNGHHGYSYAKADAVFAIGKTALQVAGLVLVNSGWHAKPETATIAGTFWLYDTETDEKMELSCELPYVAQQGRPDDKAALASLTEMRGYLMIGLLGIERVEPLDVSGREDSNAQPATRQQQQPPQRQPQKPREDDGGECKSCGAPMKFSQKSGKWYCGDLCWKQAAPAANGREY